MGPTTVHAEDAKEKKLDTGGRENRPSQNARNAPDADAFLLNQIAHVGGNPVVLS